MHGRVKGTYHSGTKEANKIQIAIPIKDIMTLATANLVLGALVLSLVGATIAVTVRHLTIQNWNPHIQDGWYYVFSGAISISLVVLGMDTATVLAATTGVNTPLAILKSAMDRNSMRKEKVVMSGLSERLATLEGK